MKYDSAIDTYKHMLRVKELMNNMIVDHVETNMNLYFTNKNAIDG